MTRTFQSLCIAVLFLFAVSSVSRAQIVANSVDVAGTLGYAHVDGVTSNNHVPFGGSGIYNLGQPVALGFEYNYTPLGSENLGSGVTGSAHLQTYGAVARFSVSPSSQTVPYALVGFGGINEKAVASEGSIHASAGQSGYYIALGGGFTVFLARNWGIRPEFRYERQIFSANSDFTAYNQNDAMATVSVFYQFGAK